MLMIRRPEAQRAYDEATEAARAAFWTAGPGTPEYRAETLQAALQAAEATLQASGWIPAPAEAPAPLLCPACPSTRDEHGLCQDPACGFVLVGCRPERPRFQDSHFAEGIAIVAASAITLPMPIFSAPVVRATRFAIDLRGAGLEVV